MNKLEKLILKTKMNKHERSSYKENYNLEASRCAQILGILEARQKYNYKEIQQPTKDVEIREYLNRNGTLVKVTKPL